MGLGGDFVRYCGELDQKLSEAVAAVRSTLITSPALDELKAFIEDLPKKDGSLADENLAKARVAVLIDLHARPSEITSVISVTFAKDIQGRLTSIVGLLRKKNVFLLPGGALEHYLPSYSGHRYKLKELAKRSAVEAEVSALSKGLYDDKLAERYGALFENIARLPANLPSTRIQCCWDI